MCVYVILSYLSHNNVAAVVQLWPHHYYYLASWRQDLQIREQRKEGCFVPFYLCFLWDAEVSPAAPPG